MKMCLIYYSALQEKMRGLEAEANNLNRIADEKSRRLEYLRGKLRDAESDYSRASRDVRSLKDELKRVESDFHDLERKVERAERKKRDFEEAERRKEEERKRDEERRRNGTAF
jgi:colicin import membrane protein